MKLLEKAVYLDVCALGRPYDDQSYPRIQIEKGPVEARRFLSIRRSPPREDSMERHRKWQDSLDRDDFFTQAMAAHRTQEKKP